MANLLPIIVLMVVLLLVLAFWVPVWLTQLRAGRPAPDLGDIPEGGTETRGRQYFYFYGPRCGQCRQVTPLVEALASRGEKVVKLDITRSQGLAQRFGVRVVPALIRVEGTRLIQVLVGPGLRRRLKAILAAPK